MKRIGILGGTFDPPHLGHMIIAEEVCHTLMLDEVWFMPAYEPPHKQKARTAACDRVAMLERAIQTNERFRVHTIELDRKGKSYTYDTIKMLNQTYSDTAFYFIIGADMVQYLPHWHQIDALAEMIKFVGVKRTGYELSSKYPVMEVDVPAIEISSTGIRERISKNIPITYLVPEAVGAYIKEKALYGNK